MWKKLKRPLTLSQNKNIASPTNILRYPTGWDYWIKLSNWIGYLLIFKKKILHFIREIHVHILIQCRIITNYQNKYLKKKNNTLSHPIKIIKIIQPIELSCPVLTVMEMGDHSTLNYNVKVTPLIKSKITVVFLDFFFFFLNKKIPVNLKWVQITKKKKKKY